MFVITKCRPIPFKGLFKQRKRVVGRFVNPECGLGAADSLVMQRVVNSHDRYSN
jgi:hypothetical protein